GGEGTGNARRARTAAWGGRDEPSRLEGGRARRAGTDRRADVLLAGDAAEITAGTRGGALLTSRPVRRCAGSSLRSGTARSPVSLPGTSTTASRTSPSAAWAGRPNWPGRPGPGCGR